MDDLLLRYWGKARNDQPEGRPYHPLVHHSLDVAAVAQVWWETDPALARCFSTAFGAEDEAARARLKAWVLFFIAVHDLGKFDIRFQLKALDALRSCWPELDLADVDTAPVAYEKYAHGIEGCRWFAKDYVTLLGLPDSCDQVREAWQPWVTAVAGHHGDLNCIGPARAPEAEDYVIRHDRDARAAWFRALEALFLAPAGLGLHDLPPPCGTAAQNLLAGFCSVADWLGSNDEVFGYDTARQPLEQFFQQRVALARDRAVVACSGLTAAIADYPGIHAILPPAHGARGVQTLVDRLPAAPGLLLVEAPTGSGKTEAALGYAWRLLAAGMADSIVFALPTQATANAMLSRVEALAGKLFPQGSANLVLAHGKRDYNVAFKHLVEVGHRPSAQGREDASAQCAGWLAQSRKRVFLGQIGVCTIDQVLLAVLPIKHKFVRGFGVHKSVLIVDEVHAYDSYMYGLLGEVLERQRAAGGSAILLSATLPPKLRNTLLQHWQADAPGEEDAYPLLTHAVNGDVASHRLPPEQQPPERVVETECLALPDALPDEALIARIIAAAEAGARVGIVCNLVDVAQKLARALRAQTSVPVDIFHARYRFRDRQEKEKTVLDCYGKEAARGTGRILVATQVVEQSLDLDFDWMLTQICPVDLLFQRLGRLHRHERARPTGFAAPRCTVLTVDGDDYGLHKLIYGNTRVLWRTEQLLRQTPGGCLIFPDAYRRWIEAVYQRDDWADEPERIRLEYKAFSDEQDQRCFEAQRFVHMTLTQFADEDTKAAALTRDGEMSLNVLPVMVGGDGATLLDGTPLARIDEWERGEVLDLNTVAVPVGWDKLLMKCPCDEDGRLRLTFTMQGAGDWIARAGQTVFRYTPDFGLEKGADEPA
ncbi:MAG: CRISPR-associated helicase/endonuclease Cas3 [Pseudomonadota bacterium]